MPKRKSIKRKKFHILLPIVFFILVVGSWLLYSRPTVSPTINKIVTTEQDDICGQEFGNCISNSGQCAQYTNTCIKAKICAIPYQTCGRSPVPTPSLSPSPSTIIFCDTDAQCPKNYTCSSTPPGGCPVINGRPTTCAHRPYCYPPKMTPTPVPTSPIPTSTPIPTRPPRDAGLLSFKATRTCGPSHFLSIVFSCKNGLTKDIANNTCSDFSKAMSYALEICGKEAK